MHLKTDPVLVLFPHWQVKEDEMDQYGSSACSFPSLLASHSTHSKPFLGSIHAFDNIFLQAISLYVNTFHFNVRFEPWQLGEAEVPPTGTVPCEQKLEILTRVQPSLKCCSLAVCAVLPPVYFPAQSCHCFCRLRAMCHMWGKITGHMNSQFWGTKNYTKWQCHVLYKNQISWFSHACLNTTSVAWELNSSLFSKETLEQNRESYSRFVTLHFCSLGLVSSSV